MKSFVVFISLILLILALEETPDQCDYLSTVNKVKSLSDCQQILKDDTENKCCLGVRYMFGQNTYFCHQFKQSASQEEVDATIEDLYVNKTLEQYYGVVVKAQGSCVNEVKPFGGNKCNVEDTQLVTPADGSFKNCTNNDRDKSSDFCCLFTGIVRSSDGKETDVHFCSELSEAQVNDMEESKKRIEIDTEMVDVINQYCAPEKVQPVILASYINYNLFIFGLLLILIF